MEIIGQRVRSGARLVAILAATTVGAPFMHLGCASGDKIEEEARDAACSQLDKISAQQWQHFFKLATSQLETQGVHLDREMWRDPGLFVRYLKAFRDAVDCPEPPAPPLQRARTWQSPDRTPLHHDSPGPDDFCGPGHNGLLNKHVSNCLNQQCFLHDSCYARCSKATHLTCMWNDATRPCDDEFFRGAEACPTENGTIIDSAFVIAAARALTIVPGTSLGCEPDTECPGPGQPGFGPCAKDRPGQACRACLDRVDPKQACFNHACFDPGDNPDICYTANCAKVSECFGWGRDNSGIGGTGGASGAAGATQAGNAGTAASGAGGKPGGAGGVGGVGGNPGGTGGGGGKGGGGGPTCHDPCAAGPPMLPTCSACVSKVCASDSYCCTASWDNICVDTSASLCGLCPGACSDPGDPNSTAELARELPAMSDCSGTRSVAGVIASGTSDVDFYKFWGSDDFGCSVTPSATVSTPGLKLCVWSTCAYKYLCTIAPAAPILSGSGSGCCANTPATISINTDCDGISDDAWIYMKVYGGPETAACSAYQLDYHY